MNFQSSFRNQLKKLEYYALLKILENEKNDLAIIRPIYLLKLIGFNLTDKYQDLSRNLRNTTSSQKRLTKIPYSITHYNSKT